MQISEALLFGTTLKMIGKFPRLPSTFKFDTICQKQVFILLLLPQMLPRNQKQLLIFLLIVENKGELCRFRTISEPLSKIGTSSDSGSFLDLQGIQDFNKRLRALLEKRCLLTLIQDDLIPEF